MGLERAVYAKSCTLIGGGGFTVLRGSGVGATTSRTMVDVVNGGPAMPAVAVTVANIINMYSSPGQPVPSSVDAESQLFGRSLGKF